MRKWLLKKLAFFVRGRTWTDSKGAFVDAHFERYSQKNIGLFIFPKIFFVLVSFLNFA